jgi:Domain of unknown function (DUF4431)
LQLATPICVLGGDDSDQPAEPSIRHLQIAFIKIPFDKSLPGHRVRIIGTLFHSMTGHHHTRALISELWQILGDGVESSGGCGFWHDLDPAPFRLHSRGLLSRQLVVNPLRLPARGCEDLTNANGFNKILN